MLERGQVRVDREEAVAGGECHVNIGKAEQRGIERAENHQGRRIDHEKFDRKVRGCSDPWCPDRRAAAARGQEAV